MTTIILIRHAPTQPDKTRHSTEWQLSDESRNLCHRLAEQIKSHNLTKIYVSTETKAQLTGQFVAEKLEIDAIEIVDNLQETERHTKAFYENQDEFRAAVREAMNKPDELLFGDETFTDAKNRLATQVQDLAEKHPGGSIGIVSHGRVLAMYMADLMEESPETIWQKLKMPAYAVLSWDQQKITKIQYEIEAK